MNILSVLSLNEPKAPQGRKITEACFQWVSLMCNRCPATGSNWHKYVNPSVIIVIVNDHISQVSSLSYGVPQGSVLGPILFILYTKPLSDLIQCHSIESQSFADDTQLQVSVFPSICNIFSGNLSVRHSDLDAGKQREALPLRSSSKFFSISKPATISVCDCELSFSSEMLVFTSEMTWA